MASDRIQRARELRALIDAQSVMQAAKLGAKLDPVTIRAAAYTMEVYTPALEGKGKEIGEAAVKTAAEKQAEG